MKVLVDVRTLMTNLEALNPGADLTLVKVYLFDLAMGRESSGVAQEEGVDTEEDSRSEPLPSETDEPVSTSSTPLVDSILDKVPPKTGLPKVTTVVKTGGSIKTRSVTVSTGGSVSRAPMGKLSREEKLAKRAEMEKVSNVPTKDLLAQITQDLEKKRGENGQVIDEGVEGGTASPGDLTLG
jgi:hypothetical protein